MEFTKFAMMSLGLGFVVGYWAGISDLLLLEGVVGQGVTGLGGPGHCFLSFALISLTLS